MSNWLFKDNSLSDRVVSDRRSMVLAAASTVAGIALGYYAINKLRGNLKDNEGCRDDDLDLNDYNNSEEFVIPINKKKLEALRHVKSQKMRQQNQQNNIRGVNFNDTPRSIEKKSRVIYFDNNDTMYTEDDLHRLQQLSKQTRQKPPQGLTKMEVPVPAGERKRKYYDKRSHQNQQRLEQFLDNMQTTKSEYWYNKKRSKSGWDRDSFASHYRRSNGRNMLKNASENGLTTKARQNENLSLEPRHFQNKEGAVWLTMFESISKSNCGLESKQLQVIKRNSSSTLNKLRPQSSDRRPILKKERYSETSSLNGQDRFANIQLGLSRVTEENESKIMRVSSTR